MSVRRTPLAGSMLALAAVAAAGIGPAFAADAERGREVWRKCAICHTLEPMGRNRVGPRLHGLFGRVAGSVPDYPYSKAMKALGIVWSETTLNDYLKNTESYVPGTKMYAELRRDQDRADLIQFLKLETTPR